MKYSGLKISVFDLKYFWYSQQKHMLWVLKRDGSDEHPKQMLKMMGKKIFKILCSEVLLILIYEQASR